MTDFRFEILGANDPLSENFRKYLSGFIDGTSNYVSWPNVVKIGRCEVAERSSGLPQKKLGETHPSLPLCPKWADRAPERCHPICTEFCPDRRECMTLSSCTQDAGRRASRQVDSESAQNVQLTAPSNRAATAAELIVEGSSINASEYTVVYRLYRVRPIVVLPLAVSKRTEMHVTQNRNAFISSILQQCCR